MKATPYYDQDGITIHHGEALGVLNQLPTASANVLMADPPYSSGGMFRSDRALEPDEKYRGWSQNENGSSRKPTSEYGSFAGDTRDQRGYQYWTALWMAQAHRIAAPGAHAFVFTDWRQLPTVTDAVQAGGWVWRGIVVWDKGVGRPMKGRFRNHLEYAVWATHGAPDNSGAYPSTLINVPTVGHGERQHVTQKPVALFAHLLSLVPAGGVVLDPFMGSGSTLLAAYELGYKAIGIEIDERYCEIAVNRLAQPSMFQEAS